MFKTLHKKKKRGFTLIELLIVLVILAILVAIALPRYNKSRQKAAIIAHNANVRVLKSAAQTYLMNNTVPDKGINWPADSSWEEYLEGESGSTSTEKKWYRVPQGVPKKAYEEISGKDYEVTIASDGKITVKPGIIDEDQASGGETKTGSDEN